jgi:hypothetical protein
LLTAAIIITTNYIYVYVCIYANAYTTLTYNRQPNYSRLANTAADAEGAAAAERGGADSIDVCEN